ncbi:MAG: AAC(3) family N-acetyltransferase [Omnitrophica WOR_2 bacterium]
MSPKTETIRMELTQKVIEDGLRQLGLGRGYAVEVHSSLSSFGRVEGGAAAVVDALINVVGKEGALVMSAYPLSKPLPLSEAEKARGILAKVQTYNLDYDGPTGMGAIADEFRRRPGIILGPGFHRVCAWGFNADMHSQGYQYLLEIDGWVLLLGVDIANCSSMHQAEKVGIPDEITRFFKVPQDIRRDYPEDIYLAYGSTPDDAWRKVQAEAEYRGWIKKQKIGEAECRLFKAKPVVGMYEEALRTDPYGLFGVKPG